MKTSRSAPLFSLVIGLATPTLVQGSPAPAVSAPQTQLDPSLEVLPAANRAQRRVAASFILGKGELVGRMAHPTLEVDEVEAFIDDDDVVLVIEYAPSAILKNRYRTVISYELGRSGIVGASVTRDTALTGAFDGLELVKELAAELLRDAQREGVTHVAVRTLELALRQDVSGNRLHLLVLQMLWAQDGTSSRYADAGE